MQHQKSSRSASKYGVEAARGLLALLLTDRLPCVPSEDTSISSSDSISDKASVLPVLSRLMESKPQLPHWRQSGNKTSTRSTHFCDTAKTTCFRCPFWPKTECSIKFDTLFCGAQSGVTWYFSCSRQELFLQSRSSGNRSRTHAVAGNRGSSRSDVDLVASLRLAWGQMYFSKHVPRRKHDTFPRH